MVSRILSVYSSQATTGATDGLTGSMYSLLVVVMLALAWGIIWNIGATSSREAAIQSLTSEVDLLKEQVGKGETETQSFSLEPHR